MLGLIGKKLGMTSIYNEDGKNIPCTILEAGPCYVTQVRDEKKDGYNAVQVGYEEKKEKHTSAGLAGHFKKAGVTPLKKLVEFRDYGNKVNSGDVLTVDVFSEGMFVDVIGTSKGKGFQGVVKRHNFRGVGGQTHGQHNRMRAPGSIGAASTPSRVFKGMRMAGQTGSARVKTQNLQVLKIIPEKNLIVVKGSVPGHRGAYVTIER